MSNQNVTDKPEEPKASTPASGSEPVKLMLECPDCKSDQWKPSQWANEGYVCVTCWQICHRQTTYTVGYLQGYHRAKRAAQNADSSDTRKEKL